MNNDGYYIGLMSGTSIDAIDATLVDISSTEVRLHSAYSCQFSAHMRKRIQSLFEPGQNEIDQLGALDIELAELYASAVHHLLKQASLKHSSIIAIGSHGQTIRHRPNGALNDVPFSLQIGDPNTIAAKTGITTVADFRRKDIAVGGQGAPLAPLFHSFLCRQYKNAAVLNLGGIANISVIGESLIGFDTGPANALLDAWYRDHHRGIEAYFDKGGHWAITGKVQTKLLARLCQHPFFSKKPPKSTGKEEFTLTWLQDLLTQHQLNGMRPEDVQATLVALSAKSIAEAIKPFDQVKQLFCCGGGVRNTFLMQSIASELPGIEVKTSDHFNIAPEAMEACAFAWLAQQTLMHSAHDLRSVTGAAKPVILGGVYFT